MGESFSPMSLRTIISASFMSGMGNLISQELLEVWSDGVGFVGSYSYINHSFSETGQGQSCQVVLPGKGTVPSLGLLSLL